MPEFISPAAQPQEDSFIQSVIAAQQAMQQSQADANAMATRYLFLPFKDRELTLDQQGRFGGIPEIRAGRIIPIAKGAKQRVPDDSQIADVPLMGNNIFMPTEEGLTREKLIDCMPQYVLEGILGVFNPHFSTPGSPLDNGMCEVEILRGSDDMEQCVRLNQVLLPGRYDVAQAMQAQLESAGRRAASGAVVDVAKRLIRAVEQSVRWANRWYVDLELKMENPQRSGKWELSELDIAVCRWLGRPEPRRRSNLAGFEAPAAQAPRATVQCYDCGAESNLLPDGSFPKKGCASCGSATFGRETATVAPVVASEAEQAEFARVVDEETPLQTEQRMMRERNKRR